MIQPVAGAVNPILGMFVGALAGLITYFAPKNAAPKTG
jgi:ammonia channel protein AmtB